MGRAPLPTCMQPRGTVSPIVLQMLPRRTSHTARVRISPLDRRNTSGASAGSTRPDLMSALASRSTQSSAVSRVLSWVGKSQSYLSSHPRMPCVRHLLRWVVPDDHHQSSGSRWASIFRLGRNASRVYRTVPAWPTGDNCARAAFA